MTRIIILALIFALSACSTSRRLNIEESLQTAIKHDGSKVFTFTVWRGTDKTRALNQSHDGQRVAKRDKKTRQGDNRQPTATATERNANKAEKRLEEYFQQRLDKLTILTLFCRKGYFVLEQVNLIDEISMQAECNESANEQDYKRFRLIEVDQLH